MTKELKYGPLSSSMLLSHALFEIEIIFCKFKKLQIPVHEIRVKYNIIFK